MNGLLRASLVHPFAREASYGVGPGGDPDLLRAPGSGPTTLVAVSAPHQRPAILVTYPVMAGVVGGLSGAWACFPDPRSSAALALWLLCHGSCVMTGGRPVTHDFSARSTVRRGWPAVAGHDTGELVSLVWVQHRKWARIRLDAKHVIPENRNPPQGSLLQRATLILFHSVLPYSHLSQRSQVLRQIVKIRQWTKRAKLLLLHSNDHLIFWSNHLEQLHLSLRMC
jgi:hypothetical protein